MQELIDMIERKSYLTKDDIIFEANKLLEKERQMVIDAYEQGHTNGWVDGSHDETEQLITGIQYFELTYNNK